MAAASLLWRLLLLSWLLLGGGQALAEVAVPPLKARVNDLTSTLTARQAGELESLLRDFETRKGSQIAVLMLPSTRPESIEQYAIRVVEQWKLGRKGVDDGLLLLVATEDRAMRFEVGYGLEGALSDAVAKRIISEVITPFFREGDFYGGIRAGLQRSIQVIEGEPLPPPARSTGASGASLLEDTLPLAMLFIFVVGGMLRALLGRFLGGVVAGGISFMGAWMLLGSFLIALVIAIVVLLITIGGSGRGGPFMGGGGGFGGGGGGGFSGGGGGFGGGGASGKW